MVGIAPFVATCVFFSAVKAGEIILLQVIMPMMLGIGLLMFAASIGIGVGIGFLAFVLTEGVRQVVHDALQRRRESAERNKTIPKAEASMMMNIAECGRQLFFKDPPCTSSSSRATAENSLDYQPVSQPV